MPMIRGVNIGGWLVLERYITPSVFAINKCHLEGDFCWYPESSVMKKLDKASSSSSSSSSSSWLDDANILPHHEMKLSTLEREEEKQTSPFASNKNLQYQLCSKECTDHPALVTNIFNATDFALDEWNLAQLFREYASSPAVGEEWLNVHFETFVTFDDLRKVKAAGMTHIRVPLPHWILQDHPSSSSSSSSNEYKDLYSSLQQHEPYLVGDRWRYFVRLCGWAHQLGLQVWPNIHTAPQSQNAFDNSGHQGSKKTCQGWMSNSTLTTTTTTVPLSTEHDHEQEQERGEHQYPLPVWQSLQILKHITQQIKADGLDNVVTGFGLLNEPYTDCDMDVYKRFLDDGLAIVRTNLDSSINVFVSDAFWAPQFNDGTWWLDPSTYHGTYLDSHYYTVFTNDERHMQPAQHIDHVCHPPSQKGLAIADCCYQDPHHSNSTQPSQGVGRIVTEFSAAFDSMPGELLKIILQGYLENGQAPPQTRTVSEDRQRFLILYTQAQIIAFEQATSVGWFFWSLKMEHDAFLEWDFLRALERGWFPTLSTDPYREQSSFDLYGSCDSLADQAAALNASDVVHTYPWGDAAAYQYWDPLGLGWKFDHEQQEAVAAKSKSHNQTNMTTTTTNKSEPVAKHNDDDSVAHKMQNISVMMTPINHSSSNVPSMATASGDNESSSSSPLPSSLSGMYHTVGTTTTTHIWV